MWLSTQAGDLTGAIDGVNTAFVAQVSLNDGVQVFINGLVRLPGPSIDNGYALSGQTLTLAEAPEPGDVISLYVPEGAGLTLVTNLLGPSPDPGATSAFAPTLTQTLEPPMGALFGPVPGSVAIQG